MPPQYYTTGEGEGEIKASLPVPGLNPHGLWWGVRMASGWLLLCPGGLLMPGSRTLTRVKSLLTERAGLHKGGRSPGRLVSLTEVPQVW